MFRHRHLDSVSAQQLNELFQELESALSKMEVDHIELKTHNVLPDKPREGQVYKADGTNWNPGSGAGVYLYQSSAWVKL